MLLCPDIPVVDNRAGEKDTDAAGKRRQHRKPPSPAVDPFHRGVEAHGPAPEEGRAFRGGAAVDNLLSDPSPFMERAVFYNSLTAVSVDAIEAKAREAGSAVLRQINSDAANLQNEDMNTPTANQRFRFGLFFYREDEGPEAPGEAASQSTTKDAE